MPRRRTPRPAWVLEQQAALGRRIAQARRAAGLSQDDLADLVGLERRSIQRYENAVRDPQYADLLVIARALQVPLIRLLEG